MVLDKVFVTGKRDLTPYFPLSILWRGGQGVRLCYLRVSLLSVRISNYFGEEYKI